MRCWLVGNKPRALSLSFSLLSTSFTSSFYTQCVRASLSPLPKLYCLNPGGESVYVYIYSHSLFSSNGRVPDEEGEREGRRRNYDIRRGTSALLTKEKSARLYLKLYDAQGHTFLRRNGWVETQYPHHYLLG
jgi:hypothetical protein